MDIYLHPLAALTGGPDSCRLVLADGQLAAVLVWLGDEDPGFRCGAWYLEAGFGPCAITSSTGTYFASLEEAVEWVRKQLSRHDALEPPNWNS